MIQSEKKRHSIDKSQLVYHVAELSRHWLGCVIICRSKVYNVGYIRGISVLSEHKETFAYIGKRVNI